MLSFFSIINRFATVGLEADCTCQILYEVVFVLSGMSGYVYRKVSFYNTIGTVKTLG